MSIGPPIVSLEGIHKRYGGVVALNGMDLAVYPGTIHAVVGENGAGKSTLMKILAGVERSDEGTISVRGEVANFTSPRHAQQHGVGIVYQELSLFPHLSVIANLFVGVEPTRYGLVSRQAMRRRARSRLQAIGLAVNLAAPVASLAQGEQQLVEIVRVLLQQPHILILDEPNSSLNAEETARLFAVLRTLRAAGIALIYISHRLEEVFALADTVTVIRDGRHIVTRPRADLTINAVIAAMVGQEGGETFPPRPETAPRWGNPLRVQRLSVARQLHDISFEAWPGEVVGIAGLEGSGVRPLLRTLFGLERIASGAITYPDGHGAPGSPSQAARRGICLVPADRKTEGLMLERTVAMNVSQVVTGALSTGLAGWVRPAELAGRADRYRSTLGLKFDRAQDPVNQLSGGNQQKIVLAKWLEANPNVMLLDDPTRGVGISAKREIYRLVRQLAAQGRVILLSSSELPELLGLSDRILIMRGGRVVAEQDPKTLDDSQLLQAINTAGSM